MIVSGLFPNHVATSRRRRSRLHWLSLLLIATGFGASGHAVRGEVPTSNPLAVEAIEVGLAGHFKVAEWTALRLLVRAPDACQVRIEIEVPDSDDNPTTFPSPVFDLPAGQPQRLETYFRTGRLDGEILVRLYDPQGGLLHARRLHASARDGMGLPPALRHSDPLWVTLSELPELRTEEKPASSVSAEEPYDPRVARLGTLSELPENPLGLRSVDMLVLSTARQSDGRSLLDDLTPAGDALLREWVRAGGHLLLGVGSEEAAYRNSLLAAWVPVRVEGEATYRGLSDLERYANVTAPLNLRTPLKGARLTAAPDRNAPVKEGGSPVIATLPYGFGQVTVIAADFDVPPLSRWSGLPAVLRKLAGGSHRSARKTVPQTAVQLTQSGVSDLATQLQTAQEDFPEVPRPSHWWVMGLLAGWLVIVGPLDHLVVNRWLRRPELTWLTLPLLVCAGAGAAAWGAGRINDRGLQFNQLDLVDFDAASKTIRGRSWITLYSPANQRFRVSVEHGNTLVRSPAQTATGAAPSRLSWSGVPENSVSGTYRSGGTGLGGHPYRFEEGELGVANLPILQWSTKTLSAEWQIESDQSLVECDVVSAGAGQLTGSVVHHLPGPLEECLFVVGGWVYLPVGQTQSLPPNVPWQPGGAQARARDLKALLTGESRMRKEVDALRTEILTTTVPWNPLGRNRVDLMNMLSFHQAVGGSDYTTLAGAALRNLELTRLMELGRGILVGRVASPAGKVQIDGATPAAAQNDTFVRLVVPVTHRDRATPATIPKAGERQAAPSSVPTP